MEFLILVLIVIVLIILVKLNAFTKENLRQNKIEINQLNWSLNKIRQQLNEIKPGTADPIEKEVELEDLKEVKEDVPSYQAANIPTEEPSYLESVLESYEEEAEIESLHKSVDETVQKEAIEIPVSPIHEKEYEFTPKAKPKNKEPKKSFFEKNPDIEKFIGENLINKIGIVILVFGLGFLVKYAIDKNWIDEVGRVAIGVLSAGILIGLAHKLRKGYKPFSSVLIGGGLALLYFTISLAFHTEGYPLYQQQTTSFIILLFITIFAVFLSVTYNRMEIAILAMLGGFGAPLMISNGSGNYIILFSYMMLLNIGMLVLSYYKKWRLVNIVAFALTVLLFGSWLVNELIDGRDSAFVGAVFYATGFYVIFFLMNIIYNIKYKVDFKVGDVSLILSNTFIYFSFVMLMLPYINEGAYKGLFSVLLGAFNFVFAFYIYKRQETDKNLLYLLIGLVFTFITLAIPLQLNGNYITLFWSIESALLLWLSQKSGFKVMKIGSSIVLALMLISIAMDWSNSYTTYGFYNDDYTKALALIFNKMFITTLISVISLVATFILLKNEKESKIWFIPFKTYRLLIIALMLAVFYIGGLLEVNYQAYHYFLEKSSQSVALMSYNALFVLSLLLFAHQQNNKSVSKATAILSSAFIVVFLLSISSVFAKSVYSIINGEEELKITLLLFRWISIISVYAISILLFKLIKKMKAYLDQDFSKASIVFLVFTILYLLSADLDAIGTLITQNKDILLHTQKTGYAILWGMSSFLLMIIGMKRKNKTLRILSLALFAITITKLFVYDISNIPEGGKIVAFILLGVLLLIISFMYQKIKKLVAEDDDLATDKISEEELTIE